MKNSLIGLMREAALFMKGTALITAVSLTMLVASPTAMALRTDSDSQQTLAGDSNPEARLSALLEQITQKFDALEAAHETGQGTDAIVSELDRLQDQMIALDHDVMANFEAMEQKLKDKYLPETILIRHQDMVAHYQAHRARIIEQFEDKDMSHWRWLLGHWWDRLLAWLGIEIEDIVDSPIQTADPRQFKRSHQAFDPNNLPNKSIRPDKDNSPKLSRQDYYQASLFNSPTNRVAGLGDFTYDALAGASDPVYLAETDEVNLTQPIKDQALALNYDPVKIYHWVRNNVEWQPSWGAVQDAELTLDAKRGNAMDIASLTIALLRASQIPARYVHGTIEVPEAVFRNWVGGFTSIDAAVDYAASGGIPTAAVIAGGKIASVQLEHVWVEAAIDYFPSRGASNRDADAWVQMDPSYKQYEYRQGLDAVGISGIDTNQATSDFLASGNINKDEGWIQGFDPGILENAQAQVQTALEDYINTNIANPTVGDVIGGRKTIVQEHPVLPSSLPNRILVEGARYDKVPNQLQQRVTYTLGTDKTRRPLNPTTFAWSTLNNEKLTLSFRPATSDDEAALMALLPAGEVTDISQLPQSIPSYLIKVIPEFKVNGELKISGEPMALGEELVFNTYIRFPGRSNPENYEYKVVAGSYLAVNLVAGSLSSQKLADLQNSLTVTKARLESNDGAQIASLTRQEVLGNLFYAGSMGYFSQLIALSRVSELRSNAQFLLAAGYGTFGYEPKVDYLFGFPTAIRTGGVTLDIPMRVVTAANDGDAENKINFVLQTGVLSSALEHAIPEQMFNDTAKPTEAISAVKALQKATMQGQRIYQITQANISDVMPLLNLGKSTKSEIQASIAAGLEVITHTDQVSVPGYIGEGYIIVDPETGSGAYKIGGGANGAYYFFGFSLGVLMMASFLMMLNPAVIALAAAAMLIFISVFIGILAYTDDVQQKCFISGFAVGVSLGLILSGIAYGAILTYELAAISGIMFIIERTRENPPSNCVSVK